MSHDTSKPLALAVDERIAAARAADRQPIAVLDLDLTLFDNTPRTRRILVDYLLEREMSESERQARIEEAWTRDLVFSIRENFTSLGIPDEEIRSEAVRFWARRFFSGEYCLYDVPYAGAVAACRHLVRAGCMIVYLTGRHGQSMVEATIASFVTHGFPAWGPEAMLVMKPEPKESDTAYKEGAASKLRKLGRVVLAADNEPGHCNALFRTHPEAAVALVETRHSPGAPPLDPGIWRVGGMVELL